MQNAQLRFEKLVNAVSSDLYRYAFRLCRNKAMAEDLVQETFLRAWRFLDSLREEKKAKSWLMTTLRREFARQFER
ncbi:MAG: sigma-70 family RNA polymerase sigma factor, partial [Gammaproteobacteria bacterium]|nr:sigma-70 family RNA polymerase sigma factor [Gammaproteobacteria bacterium]MDX2459703.1 sigma-70 family RNA polymerase sigma factor [Gammaproteobacteria bacterium]